MSRRDEILLVNDILNSIEKINDRAVIIFLLNQKLE